MDGKGMYQYDNGNLYEGEFKNNKKNGNGIYYFNNNEFIKGQWKDDLLNGPLNYICD